MSYQEDRSGHPANAMHASSSAPQGSSPTEIQLSYFKPNLNDVHDSLSKLEAAIEIGLRTAVPEKASEKGGTTAVSSSRLVGELVTHNEQMGILNDRIKAITERVTL